MKIIVPALAVLLISFSAFAIDAPVNKPVESHEGHDHHEGHHHDHDHGHDHTDPAAEAPPPLTKEQANELVTEARQQFKQKLVDALRELKQSADAISQTVEKQIKAIEKDQYVPLGEMYHDQVDTEAIKLAHEKYVAKIDAAHEWYDGTLRKALRQDPEGHIGSAMLASLDTSVDANLMGILMDWYWHHQHLDDPPGSYGNIIRLCNRYVQLEPKSPTMYTNAAWLLWSRWVSWKLKDGELAYGEGDAEKAHALLLQGRKANMEDAFYHFDAATTFWGLARNHLPEYYTFIEESLLLAEKKVDPENKKLHVRVRLTLAHVYRQQEMYEKAKQAYDRVLEIDPQNEVATRISKEMAEKLAEQPTP